VPRETALIFYRFGAQTAPDRLSSAIVCVRDRRRFVQVSRIDWKNDKRLLDKRRQSARDGRVAHDLQIFRRVALVKRLEPEFVDKTGEFVEHFENAPKVIALYPNVPALSTHVAAIEAKKLLPVFKVL